jgi:hypothetical protein
MKAELESKRENNAEALNHLRLYLGRKMNVSSTR